VAASEAEICNLALLLVGNTQFLDDLDDPTEAGEVCAQVYEKARDAALEAYPWPFATRRQSLALIAGLEVGGWAYAYALNGDVLAPRWLDVGIEYPSESQQPPFRVEDNATYNRILLTNQADAKLVYTRKVTETGKFSPLFVEALAAKVAMYLGFGLIKKPAVGMAMMRVFDSVLARAAAAQLNQQQKGEEPASSFEEER
jgi:hypothetical protein